MTLTPVGTVNLPGDAVLFFDDDVWVSGSYSCALTIVSNKDIYLYDDLLLGATDTNYTCGLIAANNVVFPYWSDLMPSEITIQGAALAQSGTFVPEASPTSGTTQYWAWVTSPTPAKWTLKSFDAKNNLSWSPAKKNRVTFKGSAGMSGNSSLSAGFNYRDFYYDPRLTNNPPPMYPRDKNKAVQIDTWIEGQ
jgi:hypothetical protein